MQKANEAQLTIQKVLIMYMTLALSIPVINYSLIRLVDY